jgi:hypothetical protein
MTAVEERPERVAQFKADIAEMRLVDPSTARDRLLLRFGVALMIVGVVVGIYAYALSHDTKDALQQRDAIVVAITGVAITVAGAALFIRYSVGQFLKFWIARITYEQQAQTDRIVDALDSRQS